MSRKNWRITRRTALRGIGATVALPWLEMMTRTSAVAMTPKVDAPVRFAALFMPNGVHEQTWQCKGEGREFEFGSLLEPLNELKQSTLVLSQLRNKNSLTGEGHYVKTAGWLTGAPIHKTGGKDLEAGVSVDQYAAQHVGKFTPLPSMELGIDPVRTAVDMGYSTVYGSHVSWRTPNMPAAKEINPRLAFDRLFRSARLGANEDDKSVLDLVHADAKGLRARLGGSDQQKLDEYLDSVRALETRIEQASRGGSEQAESDKVAKLERPGERPPKDYAEHVKLMIDIMVTAFQTDSTRVSTFMFGNAVSGRNFSFLDGVRGSHHELSHHENDPKKLEQYRLIGLWHVKQIAYMTSRMQAIKEGERSLLDNSIVQFGSGIRDGNKHDPNNLPIVLVGKGGGKLDTGRHLVYPKHTPMTNMYVTILNCMGVAMERFSDSTGSLNNMLKS